MGGVWRVARSRAASATSGGWNINVAHAVAPSLAKMAARSYVAGSLPNTPTNIEAWIEHPHAFKMTVMPEMGVTSDDAKDMASYLYTLD